MSLLSGFGTVVLAAGFGVRLAPLTDSNPKPLLTLGRMSVIDHIIKSIENTLGDAPIVVVTNGQHGQLWQRWQQTRPTVTVASNGVTQVEDRLGAVADLARGVALLGPVDHVFVLAGDNVITESMTPHLEAAVTATTPVVLCRDLGDDVPPGRFGEITVDGDGHVTRFREKPTNPTSPLAATCTYVLPGAKTTTEWLQTYLESGDADSPGRFVAWLADRTPVRARVLHGDYFDIGNHETLADARRYFTD